MFGKVYRHNLDAKNRMRIPAKLRETLGDEYCVVKGSGGCLYVLSSKQQEELFASFNNISLYDKDKRQSLRQISMGAWDAVEDSQGRILIPEYLRRHAGIKKDIVTFENFGCIEIWAAERIDDAIDSVDFDTAVQSLIDKK